MMTKKEFAKSVLIKNGFNIKELCEKSENELNIIAFQSTIDGIALETLGLIKDPSIIEYLSNRGGIIFDLVQKDKLDTDDFYKVLTMREILSFLPDD